jgi:hypothetical protein
MDDAAENDADREDDGLGGRVARLPLGIVVRRQPGVTRWAKWVWRPVAVLPGAGPADWHEMRREGEAVEYHAATVPLEVHRALVEGYRVALASDQPSVWVVLRPAPGERGIEVHGVTASAFEAQDHSDGSEDIVEPVPMPAQLRAWLSAFVERHHHEEVFVKRQRRKGGAADSAASEPGRARPAGDVYRAPTARGTGSR